MDFANNYFLVIVWRHMSPFILPPPPGRGGGIMCQEMIGH